eukprot:m.287090 g.287090  ORF g.287090 m.287090 type:complete len:59 (+) comp40701_c0_seq47:213-389(+)
MDGGMDTDLHKAAKGHFGSEAEADSCFGTLVKKGSRINETDEINMGILHCIWHANMEA